MWPNCSSVQLTGLAHLRTAGCGCGLEESCRLRPARVMISDMDSKKRRATCRAVDDDTCCRSNCSIYMISEQAAGFGCESVRLMRCFH